jgi:hypothetical protein
MCGAYDVPRCSNEQIDLLEDVRELQISTDVRTLCDIGACANL